MHGCTKHAWVYQACMGWVAPSRSHVQRQSSTLGMARCPLCKRIVLPSQAPVPPHPPNAFFSSKRRLKSKQQTRLKQTRLKQSQVAYSLARPLTSRTHSLPSLTEAKSSCLLEWELHVPNPLLGAERGTDRVVVTGIHLQTCMDRGTPSDCKHQSVSDKHTPGYSSRSEW